MEYIELFEDFINNCKMQEPIDESHRSEGDRVMYTCPTDGSKKSGTIKEVVGEEGYQILPDGQEELVFIKDEMVESEGIPVTGIPNDDLQEPMKLGEKVKCIESGKTGEITAWDGDRKIYLVRDEDSEIKEYKPEEIEKIA